MNRTQLHTFVDSRLPGGLGVQDARDIVETVVGKGKITKTKDRQLEEIGTSYGPKFTDRGGTEYERLTGHKPVASAPHVERRSIPRSWHQVAHVDQKIKDLIENGDSVTLRLKSGREISVEPNDKMAEFIKKGYFKLYKNERDNFDFDDEGRKIWYSAHYLVPTDAYKILEDQLEKFAKRADGITKKISKELEKLHDVMHAARVNGFSPFDLGAIKAEVHAEIPKAKAAIIEYEQAVEKFKYDTQLLDYPNGEVYLSFFTKEALESVGPHIDALSLRDLVFTKDLIRASELLLDRPEIEAVDPGFGIRINYNTDTLVKNGGDATEWKEEVTTLLRDALITGELNFSKNNRDDGVLKAALDHLRAAVGEANVVDGYQIGDKDFPDHVRGTEVTFEVKPAALDEARRHIDELKALFFPHGFDRQHFALTIEAERR